MPPNNGVIERMKAACHTLVSMEIERSSDVRDVEAFRRARLPEIYRAYEAEWREAYTQDPTITVSKFVSMVTGQRVAAQRVARSKAEANMQHIHKICAEPVDPERIARGFELARAALRERAQPPTG